MQEQAADRLCSHEPAQELRSTDDTLAALLRTMSMGTPESTQSERRVYRHAPIVEAVIDVRVAHERESQLALDTAFADSIASKFPRRQPIHKVQFGFKAASDGTVNTSTTPQSQSGWKLFSVLNDRVLQLDGGGFTYSHMPPYTRWEQFRAEAEPLWQAFVETRKPFKVTRLATRYINRLRLPLGAIELKDYLRVYPELPPSLPFINSFMMQVQVPPSIAGERGQAVLTLASENSNDATCQPLVLDIDVFEQVEMSANDTAVWKLLEALRDKKNRLFEAALTERMKEKFA